jgi:hypothetical protein
VKALDRMIQKKMEFLREMTIVINRVLGEDSKMEAVGSRSPERRTDADGSMGAHQNDIER